MSDTMLNTEDITVGTNMVPILIKLLLCDRQILNIIALVIRITCGSECM